MSSIPENRAKTLIWEQAKNFSLKSDDPSAVKHRAFYVEEHRWLLPNRCHVACECGWEMIYTDKQGETARLCCHLAFVEHMLAYLSHRVSILLGRDHPS